MDDDIGGSLPIDDLVLDLVIGCQAESGEAAVVPLQTHPASPSYSHPSETSGRPLARERRQNEDLFVRALHHYFGHGRWTAQVAINLERRAKIEDVGEGHGGDEELLVTMSMLGVTKPPPKGKPPGCRPARGVARLPGRRTGRRAERYQSTPECRRTSSSFESICT